MTAASSTVRGSLRGLEVLQALNRNNFATVLELSRATGLPRPTVYRMLATLVEAGFVVRPNDGEVYCLHSSVRSLSSGFDDAAEAVEFARKPAEEFSAEVGWPVYVHTFQAGAMVTRHIVRSPRELALPRMGSSVPLLASSPGRAFLSEIDEEKRGMLLEQLLRGGGASASASKVREAECMVRDASYYGCGFRDQGMVPRTCSLAVPIRVADKPVAFMTVVVMRSVMSVNKAIDTYLPAARAQAGKIEGLIGQRHH